VHLGVLLASVFALAAPHPLSDPTGLAFDAQGNLWICNYAGHTVVEYGAAQLSAAGAPVPVRTIPGIRGANNVTFDRHGNLWAAEYDGGSVAEIRGGKVVLRIRFPHDEYVSPTALAFDRAGTLWVTDRHSDRLSGYTAAQLRTAGEKKPARSLRLPGGIVADNQSVAFDRAGRVWVVQYGLDRVVGFSGPGGRRLRVVSTPAKGPLNVTPGPDGRLWVTLAGASELVAFTATGPAVTYTGESFSNPHTIAFDPSGRLWTTQYDDTILGFERDAFGAGGSVTPSIVIRNP
jgi:virginiamycin B lyase